jgi:aryl-alcohol dehydrogenase-like predicted oxidoreductase
MTETSYTHADLPVIGKRVLRLGLASNFGLKADDMLYAADRGMQYWLYNSRYKQLTTALRDILPRDRERHVVATLAGMVYTAGMVRRGVERALRNLRIDQLDLYLLPWLGRASSFSQSIQDMLLTLKDEGKVKAVGTSIHDRPRAGQLAQDSVLDAFMLRYNAKHPGAEQDIFPHLAVRNPLVVSYTATSWKQLIRPIQGIEMPPWPGDQSDAGTDTIPQLTPALCYRFCLSSPHVHVAMTGPANRAQLDENLAALEAGPLTPDEDTWIRAYGREVKSRKKGPIG